MTIRPIRVPCPLNLKPSPLPIPKKLYFFGMKGLLPCLLLLLLVACKEHRSQPAPRPLIIPMDSGLVKADSANPFAPVDVSPMDISYFPVDYPVQKMSNRGAANPLARVIYSRPHRQGRRIFGSLVKYGAPWRLGANEATEIEFFQPVTIQGKRVDKGRYVLYAIPRQDSWTIVFNSSLFAWGLTIDAKKDLFRFDIPIQITNRPVEYFSMIFEPSSSGANLQIAWDTVMGSLPIQFQ